MSYYFLTGATGLLGAYLLRDGLLAGHRMAVLVRRTKKESAEQRIENILAHHERQLGHKLPRPVVLEGDLSQIDLDLDASSIDWIAGHCKAIIHNAASLTFDGTDRKGEPWVTNVDGTERMLELCRTTGIREYHHVSTAYVCGLREGRIMEDELDLGQTLGNDYEKSKVAAEKLVRSSKFVDAPTIYRPSIIVGDSKTGHTTTFHGFYAPLRLGHTLASKIDVGAVGGQGLLMLLGMTGDEKKNFVPVDWVSAVMMHILDCKEHHGKTYHLTPSKPTLVRMMTKVLEKVVGQYSCPADSDYFAKCDGEWFEQEFHSQMEIYRNYWRDDPEFDQTNTANVAPHLPCPELDAKTLTNLARYAITTNFGRPRPRPIRPKFLVQKHLAPLLSAGRNFSREEKRLGLQVDGPGGGQWELLLKNDQPVAAKHGLTARSTAVFSLDSETFKRLSKQQLLVRKAVENGSVLIQGNGMPRIQLEAVLESTVSTEPMSDTVA